MSQEDNTTKEKTSYVVALVFSRWPLRNICEFLEQQIGADKHRIGLIKIDRERNGNETNRTILLLTRDLFDQAILLGYGEHTGIDFKITEYEVRKHNLPGKGLSRNFFIPLTQDVHAESARVQIQNKLNVIVGFGMFKEKERPRLKIPVKSRESGDHSGKAFITFARNTPVETIALARICLHDTRLYTSEDEYSLMKCYWAKEKRKPKSSSKTGEQRVSETPDDDLLKFSQSLKKVPSNPKFAVTERTDPSLTPLPTDGSDIKDKVEDHNEKTDDL
jgi:hypothetical protein